MIAEPECRVTVLGHACLGIEARHAGADPFRILIDPWLVGSCYWRSWWHFPSAPEVGEEWWSPDVVIPSHHHADHFHYPTLRRLDRAARLVIPRFGVDVMAPELRALGFADVTEVPHGRELELAPGVTYSSYQYGFDDSVVVLEVGDTVLVDVNDAKIRGRALRQVVDDVGRPTFAFKTHSWAQAYPLSYTADDPADLALVTQATFVDDFFDAVGVLRPRYVVPFASDVAFLHPQSQHVNQHVVTRASVQEAMAARGPAGTEVVDLRPGEGWSDVHGFQRAGDRVSEDWPTRSAHIDRRIAEVASTVEDQAADAVGALVSRGDGSPLERLAGGFGGDAGESEPGTSQQGPRQRAG